MFYLLYIKIGCTNLFFVKFYDERTGLIVPMIYQKGMCIGGWVGHQWSFLWECIKILAKLSDITNEE